MEGKVSWLRKTRIEVAFTKALNGTALADNGIRELKLCLDELQAENKELRAKKRGRL